jgi:hypothetical protein
MKIAVVAGGWHFPLDFYQRIGAQSSGVDLFVVAHRNPELPIVREEKRDILANAPGDLGALDRLHLYSAFPSVAMLRRLGWFYQEAPNTVGDWEFLNQWLADHDYREYDAVLSCHDDAYVRRSDLFKHFQSLEAAPWLIVSNGRYPEAPAGYVRGSFELFRREMLDMLGGRIDLGSVSLTREGKTDTPEGLAALSSWNDTAVPLRDFMVARGLDSRIHYLSNFYRVSPWIIEAERGFIHYCEGAPWSFKAGLEAFPIFD